VDAKICERSDFALTTNGAGDRYVYLTDEMTKKHQDDDSGAEGRMYEVKGINNRKVLLYIVLIILP